MFGGEKGIRTLEYIPALHDFQSCAFDQLSHLSKSTILQLFFSSVLSDRKHSSRAATNSAISPRFTRSKDSCYSVFRIADLNIIQQQQTNCKCFLIYFRSCPNYIQATHFSNAKNHSFAHFAQSLTKNQHYRFPDNADFPAVFYGRIPAPVPYPFIREEVFSVLPCHRQHCYYVLHLY